MRVEKLTWYMLQVHLNISRANFNAQRGFRYGRDSYDERMQASARLNCTATPTPSFSILSSRVESSEDEEQSSQLGEAGEEEKSEETANQSDNKLNARDNPLRWFGILTPQTLRQAQNDAVQMVETVIPALSSVDAELRDLEIQVRRTRKHYAKAEAAERKLKQASLPSTHSIAT